LKTLPKSRKYEFGYFQFKLKIGEIHNPMTLIGLQQTIIALLTEVLAKMSEVLGPEN